MAELGSIQFQDSRQNTSVASQNDKRDLFKGIQDLGKAAIDAKTEDILGDFREDLDDTTAQAVNPSETVLPESAGTGIPEADALISRIERLQATANQGTGNTQRRIEMELRRKTEELRNKFPGLRKNIDSEFASFKQTDADFAQLALSDAASINFSKFAANQLKDIKDEAYGDAAGQLGLDPVRHRFGTAEFAKEYLYRTGINQRRAQNALLSAAITSERTLQATQLPGVWNSLTTGQTSALTAAKADLVKQVTVVGNALRNPLGEGSAALIAEWNLTGKDQALASMESVLIGMELQFQEIPVELADTVEYKAIRANKDALVAQFRLLGEAIATSNPTLMDVYNTVDTMRTFEFEAANPELTRINTMVNESAKTIELAQANDFGGDALLFGNEVAKYLNTALPKVLATTMAASGHTTLPERASTEDILNAGREFRANNPDRYGSQVSGSGHRTGAVVHTALIMSPAMATAVVEGGNPNTAAAMVGGMASYADELSTSGKLEGDAWDEQMRSMASPAILEYNKLALESAQPSAGAALGEAVQSLWQQGETRRLDSYVVAKGTDLGNGLALANVMSVDLSSLIIGDVRFVVDESAIKAAFRPTDKRSFFLTAAGVTSNTNKAIREAQQEANRLSATVSSHLKTKAHIQALREAKSEANYELQWVNGKFEAMFVPQVQEPE